MIGFRKWALAAYLVLAIYLLSNPSVDELAQRSQAFDEHLGAVPTSAVSPALAAALEVPEQSVQCYLQIPKARPSELVFNKLLDRSGPARGNADLAATVVDSGVPVGEAVAYFDKVEKAVMKRLKLEQRVYSDTTRQDGFIRRGDNRSETFGRLDAVEKVAVPHPNPLPAGEGTTAHAFLKSLKGE